MAFMLLDAFESKHCAASLVPYMALLSLARPVVMASSSAGGMMYILRRTSLWKCAREMSQKPKTFCLCLGTSGCDAAMLKRTSNASNGGVATKVSAMLVPIVDRPLVSCTTALDRMLRFFSSPLLVSIHLVGIGLVTPSAAISSQVASS